VSAMHVVRCGSGDPVLFIHGMPTSSSLWSGVMRRLCTHFSCFAVDLPGMGQTPSAPYGPGYLTLRIPESVVRRVYSRRTS
jgi:pimeloyl-ACP methyl ester carboxylesterase